MNRMVKIKPVTKKTAGLPSEKSRSLLAGLCTPKNAAKTLLAVSSRFIVLVFIIFGYVFIPAPSRFVYSMPETGIVFAMFENERIKAHFSSIFFQFKNVLTHAAH